MPPKKGKRGTAMSLADFAPTNSNSLDWARDEFAPTPPTGPADGGEKPPGMDGDKKGDWKGFGYKVGRMDGNFREEAPVQVAAVVPDDMKPPFVAYVGNLPNSIQEETVGNQFSCVVSTRMIKNDRSTFAYVEFETREALQAAIFMTGKNVGGRKIKVDIASQQQRQRLESERNGGHSRDQSNSPLPAFAGRDAMGMAQPTPGPMGAGGGRNRMGSRNASTNDFGGARASDFSRDAMGSAQPTVDTPTTTGTAVPEFSRESFGQSEAKPRTPNTRGPRGSKPASPNTRGEPPAPRGEFGNWRDGDRTAAPDSPSGSGAPTFARRRSDEPNGAGPRVPKPKPSAGDTDDAASWRNNSKPSAPQQPPQEKGSSSSADGGGWRSAPKAEQPASHGNSWRQGPPTS